MDAAASNRRLGVVLCVVIALSGVVLCGAELQRFAHPPKDDGSLSLLVVGDWGRKGAYNQSQVAVQVLHLSKLHFLPFITKLLLLLSRINLCCLKKNRNV